MPRLRPHRARHRAPTWSHVKVARGCAYTFTGGPNPGIAGRAPAGRIRPTPRPRPRAPLPSAPTGAVVAPRARAGLANRSAVSTMCVPCLSICRRVSTPCCARRQRVMTGCARSSAALTAWPGPCECVLRRTSACLVVKTARATRKGMSAAASAHGALCPCASPATTSAP